MQSLSADFWRSLFAKIASNEFLTGKNKSGWRADFSWVMSKGNFGRIADGAFSSGEIDWDKIFGKENLDAQS